MPLRGRNSFADWVQDRELPWLSTNHGASPLPFQNWRSIKESFAPELVERAVTETSDELGRRVRACSDPFGGSGTTALSCQFLGIPSASIEVNPFLADLIEAKLFRYDVDSLSDYAKQISLRAKKLERSIETPFPGAPVTFVEPGKNDQFLFWKPIAHRIAAFREAIAEVDDADVQRFYRVMLGGVVVSLSNATVSGKGRRYRRNWKNQPVDAQSVDQQFWANCSRAIFQVSRFAQRPVLRYRVLRGDARRVVSQLERHDLAVFSPPYPNSFDYTDIYNIELWALGYLATSEQNRQLRTSTLRSHVQIKRSFHSQVSSSLLLRRTISRLRDVRKSLWNRNIPEMIEAYFDDLRVVISTLRTRMRTGGRVYLVVGDSLYAGVSVPVAEVLKEEIASWGYEFLHGEPSRSMRASPQQGGHPALAESLLVLRAY